MSIDVKPKTALVTWPEAVAMSVGSAKKARYVSELPSSSSSRAIRASSEPSMTRSATARIFVRSLMARFWMNEKAPRPRTGRGGP